MSCDQYAGRNHNIKTGNKSFERVEELKHLGIPLTNKNPFIKKLRANRRPGMLAIIRCRIFGFPVYFPKMYKTIILPVVLYGCET